MRRVLLLTAGSVIFFPMPAGAGVDVVPDALNPNVQIEATREPTPSSGDHSSSSHPSGSAPVVPEEPSVCAVQAPSIGADAGPPTFVCAPGSPGAPGGRGEDGEVTEADLRRAVAEVPMPRLQARVQPAGRTLVNVPTILYAEPHILRRTVTLLGFEVDVEARPVRYMWHHGDGSSRATGSAGAPYPSKDVTHTYSRVADAVQVRVDTGWDVRFRVDGGDWTDLGEQLVSAGPATSLAVDEAAPVLTAP